MPILNWLDRNETIKVAVVVKIVVAFDQNYFITKCVNHDAA